MTGSELGTDIAEYQDGHADIGFDQGKERLVAVTAVVHFDRRDAQAFLVDLSRVRGIGARYPAPDIGVVANGCGEGQDHILVKDRLNDEDVGKMHAASERIVE